MEGGRKPQGDFESSISAAQGKDGDRKVTSLEPSVGWRWRETLGEGFQQEPPDILPALCLLRRNQLEVQSRPILKGKRNHFTRKPEGWMRGEVLSQGIECGRAGFYQKSSSTLVGVGATGAAQPFIVQGYAQLPAPSTGQRRIWAAGSPTV